MYSFEKLNNLSVNVIDLNIHQDKDEWKHNLIPLEISKIESNQVIDLIIYKNYYSLKKK